MISHDNLLSFFDFLDLDEELIDSRLKCIRTREKFTNKHLINAIQLLQYKQLVNLQDNSECDNDEEFDLVAKLIKIVDEQNVENVCKIISITLGLNVSTLENKSEHLLQQILSDLPIGEDVDVCDGPSNNTNPVLILKITDSILSAVLLNNRRISLPFLELPIKHILFSSNENMKVYFLSSTVPKLFEAVNDYNVLDAIWSCIKHLDGDNTVNMEITLKVLSSLSGYYLPTTENKGNISFKSNIFSQYEFWYNLSQGLLSTDPLIRKISIYLMKRTLDCVVTQKKNVCVQFGNKLIFKWSLTESKSLKVMWDNFFVLMDSLEEKQSNIVLPSLQLFTSLKDMGNWLNCPFNLGLKHDNTQVRLKCIQYRLETKLNSQPEAIVLLEALNDINIFDDPSEYEELKGRLKSFLADNEVIMHIFTSIPLIKWSPVPFHHFWSVLGNEKFKILNPITNEHIIHTMNDIIKVPCNNIPLRKAVHINMLHFVENCFTGLHWRDYANIYLSVQTDLIVDSPFLSLITRKLSDKDNKESFFEHLSQSHLNIDLGLVYLQNHEEDLAEYIDLINEKAKKMYDIASRQYSDKAECLNDVIYLTQLYNKTNHSKHITKQIINEVIASKFKSILLYVLSLLSNNVTLTIEETGFICKGLHSMSSSINVNGFIEEMLQLYKTSVLFIKDKNAALESTVLGLYVVLSLSINSTLISKYKHEMLNLRDILSLTGNFENKQSIGRLRNVYYEKSCEIVDTLLNEEESQIERHLEDIVDFIEIVVECGGYGCLRVCLRIMNLILPLLIRNQNIKFNMGQFLSRMWKEIEELKSNNQYTPCVEEFVALITHDDLLRVPEHNNIVIMYCKKIIDYGPVKPTPLFNLIKSLNNKVLTQDYGHVIYVLCEVLLYSPVPRKDQRITENLVVEVIQNAKYGFNRNEIDTHFNFQIQYLSVLVLSKITDPEILSSIEKFIRNRIDESFRNKQRYHGHSQSHRLLLVGLQHLLLISLMKGDNQIETMNWCVELLGKLPHQVSARICLEWYIAVQLYAKKTILNEDLIRRLKGIPVTSQFMILYWTVKHKILKGVCSNEEFDYVMGILLSHTMGQMFNIRLHAQYLSTKLYGISKRDNASQYSYTVKVIENTFIESAKDKNFVKLQNDYFANDFDIINDLTPSFLYYFLLRYCEINNKEFVDNDYVRNALEDIHTNVVNGTSTELHKEWLACHRSDDEVFALNMCKNEGCKSTDDMETTGTIQKKYVPWKNMSDINVYETEKKKTILNEDLIRRLKGIPVTSQFMILYWTVKHKILKGVCSNEEFDYVMGILLSHTMGQMFNIRLHAQYLSTKLYGISKRDNASQYSYTVKVIENTFIESAKDKNFVKLQNDYFANDFDIINDLTPSFLYYFLLRYCEINNKEFVDNDYVRNALEDIHTNVVNGTSTELHKEWLACHRSDDEVFALNMCKNEGCKSTDDMETTGTIQKKYVPWKNMSDINVYETEKKKESKSDLIVVASLIDKLPNLGGMARTSEVFGVKTYVVDSLRHLLDKQFQSLSVSAERWINVEEVRPGQPLKQYLMNKKDEGYSVVAAEQTSTSSKLQDFKFPKKTLLLLGHEKEGIPCDLLPVMDFCVEIPQQGFVRSLNVHVTAAIFVWEYARQNIL